MTENVYVSWILYWNFMEICSWGFLVIDKESCIGSENDLGAFRRQAIIWTNDDLIWQHQMTLGLNFFSTQCQCWKWNNSSQTWPMLCMAADALAPCITRKAATMVLSYWLYVAGPCLPREEFQPPAPSHSRCWEMHRICKYCIQGNSFCFLTRVEESGLT